MVLRVAKAYILLHRKVQVIEKGTPILVDIGCCIDGYVIDQTRMVSIGQVDADLVEAYAVAFDILQATEQNLHPGISCEDLYLDACRMAEESGLAEHFMGFGDDRVTFLGHGIGLEIDEWPVLAKGFELPLEPGMVIAIEPKFSFPGRGVVGIEDTYLITDSGYERLTVTPQTWYQKQP
jgi:Xaa-Pro aminopeptidase